VSAAPRPGWYPDPAGTPELYRWWDGGDWTEAISESPRAPSPRLHSPARPEDELVRRRHSPLRSVVALLLCVALFLSATVGLGLVIWQDGPRLDRGSRAPGGGPAVPDRTAAAVGRLDERSRVATVGTASLTLPADPYVLSPDPMRVPGLLDAFFSANAPVHERYDGRRSWYATVLLGRLAPGVGGPDLEERGRAAVAGLGRAFFRTAGTEVDEVAVADHSVDNHAGLLLTTRVHYGVDGLPSRYDALSVVVVELDDGSVVVAATSVPDDASPAVVAGAAEALGSLALS
jgi:hypothetical protein